jgi:hypothetical protein
VVQSTFILPVGRTTALVPVARGLLALRMPAPGAAGHPAVHLEPGTSLGAGAVTEALGVAISLAGRVVVELANSSNLNDYYFVIAGDPRQRFGNAMVPHPAAVAAGSLWSITGASLSGSLVRLNDELRPTTPGFVNSSRVLKNVDGVLSHGDTIWVIRHVNSASLACFPAQSPDGPVVTLPVKGYVFLAAAEGRTVYVTTMTRGGNPGRTVTSYPVPAACR